MIRVKVKSAPRGGIDRTLDLPEGSNGLDLLRSLGLNPNHWIISRGENVIPDDEQINEGDTLMLISVVSGG
ncbi:MAG TPA: thiamine biosynthesis protein ThiS [Euryarchaeota archaeon]|nr:thiamine biosynthesis protein ThiS [Euryarchaeota archaeon]